ncbi:hypothetical protein PRUPE_1G220100 [Prunus persica]|uniref:Uncharacterized protein n=1 Tax=Prunus persica TaxID=3760 RepID=A0A251R1D6_PRUPE|nr:hypothetical protein PRUPE_1G220100 [Prunus persica]
MIIKVNQRLLGFALLAIYIILISKTIGFTGLYVEKVVIHEQAGRPASPPPPPPAFPPSPRP